jgi:hypothetical protein
MQTLQLRRLYSNKAYPLKIFHQLRRIKFAAPFDIGKCVAQTRFDLHMRKTISMPIQRGRASYLVIFCLSTCLNQ